MIFREMGQKTILVMRNATSLREPPNHIDADTKIYTFCKQRDWWSIFEDCLPFSKIYRGQTTQSQFSSAKALRGERVQRTVFVLDEWRNHSDC